MDLHLDTDYAFAIALLHVSFEFWLVMSSLSIRRSRVQIRASVFGGGEIAVPSIRIIEGCEPHAQACMHLELNNSKT